MAKKNLNLTNLVSDVAKSSFEKANEKKVIWLKDEDILDNPLNDEDMSFTADIEEHIQTEGFRYPLTVTTFNAEPGKYYIISGHRSRKAGRNLGKTEFPCIVEDYANETEMYHAILTGNTRRNWDPLDLVTRYGKWDKYLDMINFEGNRAAKIATCLGVSIKQAEKYRAFTKIIPEFWQLVRIQGAARDGLYRLGAKDEATQKEIYDFFINCNEIYKKSFSVAYETELINAYIVGCRTVEDFEQYLEQKKRLSAVPEPKKTTEEPAENPRAEGSEEMEKEVIKEPEPNLEYKEETRVKIEGKNNNEAANREISLEEKTKYASERLSQDDIELAERKPIQRGVPEQELDDNVDDELEIIREKITEVCNVVHNSTRRHEIYQELLELLEKLND